MLSAVSPTSYARSSLEEMLDSLRRRDEQPKDLPPALPIRPISRARLPSSKHLPAARRGPSSKRLPSSRRSLPVNFKITTEEPELLVDSVREEKEVDYSPAVDKECGLEAEAEGSTDLLIRNSPAESPYVTVVEKEVYEERLQETEGLDIGPVCSPSSPLMVGNAWCDDIQYILKKKVKVWCRLSNTKWEMGMIQSLSEDDAVVMLPGGGAVTLPKENIFPANPEILDDVDDLLQLSYLNEPSVLHTLQNRYELDKIYTRAGPVLVAINPFKDVSLYGDNFISAYRKKRLDSPHVYAIVDTAFNQMMRDEVNQSIIISGESGSGKTETAKIAMQYLASLGGGSGIAHGVLQTSSILEAFGNAKTSRNDNSSRFGKLIEIVFGISGNISGAKIQTFLLEKSRVVQRARGERSYHIFYQLCAGAPSSLKERLNLKEAKDYEYLKQSNCLTIDEVDDAQKFHILMEALDVVQVCKEDQENIFALLAAVLWLGNISFSVIDNENHVEVVPNEAVTTVANLIGCSIDELMLALTAHKIKAGNDSIVQKLKLHQAIDARDALAKYIYASLFYWLVEQMNKSLEVGKQQSGRSISILDIYGFESFDMNSFEQFCINYANERLQQHFNRHLFKLDQEEYERDGIDWTKVDFEDNQDCLNLFEKKPLGLLSLLDEESTFPRGSDVTFALKLKQHLTAHPCFKGERRGAFSVLHYAGEVLYEMSGFLEKNRDLLHSDCIQLLSCCRCQLPQLFASNILNQSPVVDSPRWHLVGADSQKLSVGMKFKGQLFKLIQRLENTTPHFIRCLQPNSKQLPGVYDSNLVLKQLRCCGILEVVRISKSGYPTRMTHEQFARRYGFLLSENVALEDPLSVSVAILHQFSILADMYQVGFTKLFFRTGQIGLLEDARNKVLQGIVGVQKCFRGRRARWYFQELKKGITTLQSFVRGESMRKEFDLLVRKERAVVLIQKWVRRWIHRKEFMDNQRATILLQSVIRALLARRQLEARQKCEESNSKIVKMEIVVEVAPHDKESMQEHIQVLPSVLAELHRRVMKAEAALKQKDDENAALQQQVKQFERRWSEYEAKMKSMEETWQRQFASLQMSLAAAKRNLAADDTGALAGRAISPPLNYYESDEAISVGSRTPEVLPFKAPNHTSDFGAVKGPGAGRIAVGHLTREFEHHKQVFEDDAGFLVEVKSRHHVVPDLNPDEELRRLRGRFDIWKKEYKVRLRETKVALHKLGNTESEKTRKKWWGKRIA